MRNLPVFGQKQPKLPASDAQRRFVLNEARALQTRLEMVRPFETNMPMVVAAAIPPRARKGIYQLLRTGKRALRREIGAFIARHHGPKSVKFPLDKVQAEFSILKLRFNALLDQLDIFADVVNQRSEHGTGTWVAGLDDFAADALRLEGHFYDAPPLICYLDRGHGAAIRRARTRLPGGAENPVAVIRIPRERMVGSGIGSSLVHEVGHQGAALLGLVASLKAALLEKAAQDPARAYAWQLFARWISEIIADCWASAHLGISATTGLMGVVSLPRYFVFRLPDEDPHPFPWIRVKISLAFGRALHPHPQWAKLENLWHQLYPTAGLSAKHHQVLGQLEAALPDFVQLVLEHRNAALQGKPLRAVFPLAARRPERLRVLWKNWQQNPQLARMARPTLVFAVAGQARADGTISPGAENAFLSRALGEWAVRNV